MCRSLSTQLGKKKKRALEQSALTENQGQDATINNHAALFRLKRLILKFRLWKLYKAGGGTQCKGTVADERRAEQKKNVPRQKIKGCINNRIISITIHELNTESKDLAADWLEHEKVNGKSQISPAMLSVTMGLRETSLRYTGNCSHCRIDNKDLELN